MFIYREKIEDLKKWKESDTRKPLIIRGARQVGKTELIKEFGRSEYEKVAYISFYNNSRMTALFEGDFDIERLIQGFKAETNTDIEPSSTLIILDEVQEVPKALASLKYFYEEAPEYHIVVAGSLLGVATHRDISFPVGKVEYLELNPFSFREFLLALGENQLAKIIINPTDPKLLSVFHDKLINYVKTYYYIGGMPEVVKSYIEKKSWNEARRIQKNILTDYANDFGKHVPETLTKRIQQAWNTIPAQLAKEKSKKFAYGLLSPGARSKEYELALIWLEDAGLIRKVNRVKTPHMPIKSYSDPSAFKIYHLDIGLLSAMTNLDEKTLLEGDSVFAEFKGSLTEQFAIQELSTNESPDICYWAYDGESRAEVEFIVQAGSEIVPVEVKSGTNLRSKSLGVYIEKYKPDIAVRSSIANYKQTGNLYDVPLYMLSSFIFNIR